MKLIKMKKTLGLVLLIGIAVIGIILFIKSKLPAEQQSRPVFQSSTSEIDTSNWKTYRNEEFGFEFRYPEGYEVWTDYNPHGGREHLLGGIVYIGNNVEFHFTPNIKRWRTLEELGHHSLYGRGKIQSREILYVGGERAIRLKLIWGKEIYREEIYFRGKSRKENIDIKHLIKDIREGYFEECEPLSELRKWLYVWFYAFLFEEDPKGVSKPVFDQIVATFKFIE